jgi:hypothetical protein
MNAIFLLVLIATSLFLCHAKKKGDMNSYMKRTGAKYLNEISQKEGVNTLKSGMLVEILHESTKSDAKSPNTGRYKK